MHITRKHTCITRKNQRSARSVPPPQAHAFLDAHASLDSRHAERRPEHAPWWCRMNRARARRFPRAVRWASLSLQALYGGGKPCPPGEGVRRVLANNAERSAVERDARHGLARGVRPAVDGSCFPVVKAPRVLMGHVISAAAAAGTASRAACGSRARTAPPRRCGSGSRRCCTTAARCTGGSHASRSRSRRYDDVAYACDSSRLSTTKCNRRATLLSLARSRVMSALEGGAISLAGGGTHQE